MSSISIATGCSGVISFLPVKMSEKMGLVEDFSGLPGAGCLSVDCCINASRPLRLRRCPMVSVEISSQDTSNIATVYGKGTIGLSGSGSVGLGINR